MKKNYWYLKNSIYQKRIKLNVDFLLGFIIIFNQNDLEKQDQYHLWNHHFHEENSEHDLGLLHTTKYNEDTFFSIIH